MSFFNNVCEAARNFLDFSEEEREFQEEFSPDVSFTQAELQYLKELNTLEQFKLFHKEHLNEFWELSNKESEDGDFYFKLLNSEKSDYRKTKIQYNKLSAIQRKLKKILKNPLYWCNP